VKGGITVALLVTAMPAMTGAAEAPPGASACSGCHAPVAAGVGAVPTLEGRSAAEIATAMLDFRSGRRTGTVMDRIAKGFTEAETLAIAAWIAEAR